MNIICHNNQETNPTNWPLISIAQPNHLECHKHTQTYSLTGFKINLTALITLFVTIDSRSIAISNCVVFRVNQIFRPPIVRLFGQVQGQENAVFLLCEFRGR